MARVAGVLGRSAVSWVDAEIDGRAAGVDAKVGSRAVDIASSEWSSGARAEYVGSSKQRSNVVR